MFEIGDHIIYPTQGLGIIENFEEKEIHGLTQTYCVITISNNNMQLMVPSNRIQAAGIRMIGDKTALEEALKVFHDGSSDPALTWKQRLKQNQEKIRSGSLVEGAEVVRDLKRLQNEKSLSPNEKNMLLSAEKILLGEIQLISGLSKTQAADLLEMQV
ncbi:CarD family transcriptional regulator [Peribacillus sp. SCS-26]|uniref:CarD family transcriptional regulator n=1 Tax=Paraperibacillus marinus TaxID=3115295 RepID=UPI00390622FA